LTRIPSKDLYRNVTAEFLIEGPPDFSHPAFAEQSCDSMRTQSIPDYDAHKVAKV
jgi:hypothetical protein